MGRNIICIILIFLAQGVAACFTFTPYSVWGWLAFWAFTCLTCALSIYIWPKKVYKNRSGSHEKDTSGS